VRRESYRRESYRESYSRESYSESCGGSPIGGSPTLSPIGGSPIEGSRRLEQGRGETRAGAPLEGARAVRWCVCWAGACCVEVWWRGDWAPRVASRRRPEEASLPSAGLQHTRRRPPRGAPLMRPRCPRYAPRV
jgi:hypothetical protein